MGFEQRPDIDDRNLVHTGATSGEAPPPQPRTGCDARK